MKRERSCALNAELGSISAAYNGKSTAEQCIDRSSEKRSKRRVSQTSFGHISISSSMIPTVSTAPKSP